MRNMLLSSNQSNIQVSSLVTNPLSVKTTSIKPDSTIRTSSHIEQVIEMTDDKSHLMLKKIDYKDSEKRKSSISFGSS